MSDVPAPVSLSARLPNAVSVRAQNSSPVERVADAGREMAAAYNAYQELRVLTNVLSGLPSSSPIPDNLKFEEITVHFSLNAERKAVKLRSVQRVGDIYRLLSLEAERLVNIVRTQAAIAQNNSAEVEAACSRAQYAVNAQQNLMPT